ncbi:MAG TPA: LppX_LprAFG lipoprotein [Ilumatobacter sp.]
MTDRRIDGPELFAIVGSALAVVAFVVAVGVGVGVGGRAGERATPGASSDGAVADPLADPAVVVLAAAEAMRGVTSVEFQLRRSGAPVFIDQFGRIALDRLRGQFAVPNRAQAELTVTVNGDLTTRLGAIAIDAEVWISNPVTGDFETLPDGYDIDPSKFFDPEGGWRPLLMNLRDIELVAVDDRGGERYHVRGVAPAAQVREITVGLVRGQDVAVDLWIHPATNLVTAAEFSTIIDGAAADWVLGLDRYGDAFTIDPPEPAVD